MIADALEDLAADLRAAGFNASLDAVDVSPPGIVVHAAAVLPGSAKLCGDYPLRLTLWLVVPDTGTVSAYRGLDDLYGRLPAALAGTGTTLTADDRTFERLVMPDDPSGLPALRVTALTIVTAPVLTPTGRNTK